VEWCNCRDGSLSASHSGERREIAKKLPAEGGHVKKNMHARMEHPEVTRGTQSQGSAKKAKGQNDVDAGHSPDGETKSCVPGLGSAEKTEHPRGCRKGGGQNRD